MDWVSAGHFLDLDVAAIGNGAKLTSGNRFVDTMEGIFEMYKEMGPEGLGMVPGMKVDEPKALV